MPFSDQVPAAINLQLTSESQQHEKNSMCGGDMSQKVASLAREKFPSGDPLSSWRLNRNHFVVESAWTLFDENHDGLLSFEEFLSLQWAGYLAQGPAGACTVSKEIFLRRFLGDPGTPTSGWSVPFELSNVTKMFESIDVHKVGYITKDDIRNQTLHSFRQLDRNRDGFLSREEFH